MTRKARNATLLGVGAGIALFAIARAVIKKYRRDNAGDEGFTGAPPNRIFSAYRGKFRPHRRQIADNGVH